MRVKLKQIFSKHHECVDRVQDKGQLQAVVSTVIKFRVCKGEEGMAWPHALICEIIPTSDA
jgi:hypothetical protein